MATFLLATDGTHGDVQPFVRLGRALVERGHEVVLHTHACYAATAARAGVTLVATDTEERYARQLADHRERLINVLTNVDHLTEFYRRNGVYRQLRVQYDAMAEVISARPAGSVVLVGRHTTALSVLMARERFGVPAVWVAVTPAQYLALPLTERLLARSIAADVDRLRASIGLPPVASWGDWLASADLYLGLWPRWWDAAGPPAPAAVALSGFALNDEAETGELPPEVERRLACDRPPVLITGGSSQSLHHAWYRSAAEGCARAGRSAILVCRHRDLVPASLPAGIHWQPALPFASLMPRVAAVVSHGGILTSARGIASGVPQLVLGHGTDRPDNGARLGRLGVGAWLPAAYWKPEQIAGRLNRLIDDPRYRRQARRLAGGIDVAAALATVCDQVEALVGTVRKGGRR